MSIYELAILGSVTPEQSETLTNTINSMVSDFDLELGTDVRLHGQDTLGDRDIHAAFSAAFFGGDNNGDLNTVRRLVDASLPIIPTVGAKGDFGADIPDFLQFSNGLKLANEDAEMTELAAAMLECVGLLRRQRRVFVSYRRTEARSAAVQLHDTLSAKGFDVFLDTHDILKGEPFQDALWHRLCDSDVMVMLDTPTYFDSKWTRQEIGRARAKDIQVLRVIWPEHKPNRMTDLAESIYLEAAELAGADGPIVEATVDVISLAVERLRSRSIASRYMAITGRLRADVEKIGGTFEGIGAHRAISILLPDEQRIWAYPVVGVPSAETLNDIAEKAQRSDQVGTPVLVYDHIGIRDAWGAHLQWLDDHIAAVRSIKVSEAAWSLSGWEV
ncbi:toll/interleukin-1 receptor domain-containing protein [uncultured Pelagimonas sp.]|uniref:toll/interleukin-1 receptor domain-containing protein n=1 Tax=uncultured Pelagimonas sp. TaxID=1618102 RepID=UPI0026363585|nr:toll/interleukin-1 receptor domain-containing protein [uncultured Pelagimonas sp.]